MKTLAATALALSITAAPLAAEFSPVAAPVQLSDPAGFLAAMPEGPYNLLRVLGEMCALELQSQLPTAYALAEYATTNFTYLDRGISSTDLSLQGAAFDIVNNYGCETAVRLHSHYYDRQ